MLKQGRVTTEEGLTLHGDLPTVVAAVHIILLPNKKMAIPNSEYNIDDSTLTADIAPAAGIKKF